MAAIQQLAAPRDLYERPENAFVARFIGENNRLPGRVLEANGTECRVEVRGSTFIATMVGTMRPGEETTLSLRPERVVMGPAAAGLPNHFAADILETVFVGDHLRVRLAVCGDDGFVAKVPNIAGHGDLRAGQPVTIGWSIGDCRALRERRPIH